MINPRYIIILIVLLFEAAPVSGQGITYGEIYGRICTGHLNDAADLLEKYIRQNPGSLDAYKLLGKVNMAIGGPNDRTAAEYLELDLSRIERGPVRITVTVHDLIGGEKTNGAIELELE